jgi:hypothetical protein
MNISPALLSSGLASVKLQLLGVPGNSTGGFDSMFASLISPSWLDSDDAPAGLLDLVARGRTLKTAGLSAGRNMALADPESAYRMMSIINSKHVLFKAQFSELSEMGKFVAEMQEAGQALEGITTAMDNDSIKSALQAFVNQYNDWIQRFRTDLEDGGLLDEMQAAEISQYELEQSVKYRFYGVDDGLNGLGDLGVAVDPVTRTISLDTAKLDVLLAGNKQGTVDALHEFGANFARAAAMLNSDNNFILNQLDNLGRAIRYIDDNSASLRKEFGTGDAARPTGQVAQALAAYEKVYEG